MTHRPRIVVAALLLAALTLTGCGSDGGGSGTATDHNDADVQFAQMMIPHHQQAVEMSKLVLQADGIDPAVTMVAKGIKAAQAPEIELMQGWLQQWGAEVDEMDGMHGMGGDGMLSDDDMSKLGRAEGDELSMLFLEGMIGHHRGAIGMARHELDAGSSSDARKLASQIIESQGAEIKLMRDLLGT